MRRVSMLTAALAAAFFAEPALATEYNLTIGETKVNFTGDERTAIAVNGEVPAPLLRFQEGEEAVIHVTNTLDVPTSVHWHGLLLPGEMDGVPGFNGFPGIAPGETFTYRFTVRQSGTYWYHAHSEYQEQEGLYGAMILDPKAGDPAAYDREHVIFLSDWTDEKGAEVHANLKSMPDYYNYAQRTVFDFFDHVQEEGFGAALQDRLDWGEMRMMPTDIADVSGYTFLMNGKTDEERWTGTFKPGERVRLRLINGSAMSYFDFRIPSMKLGVVQADGQNIHPVMVDELRIATAETYDIIITPEDDTPLQIIAEAMDRTGFALGELTADGKPARLPRPAQRERALLTMADMGVRHEMQGGHQGHGASAPAPHDGHADHGAHKNHAMPEKHEGHGNHGAMPAPEKESFNHRLSPPVGAPEGARVLSYADLKALEHNDDLRAPQREIEVRLGGNMERYLWTINGKKFEDAKPIELHYGERVKLTFINESMMNHPMHLHGLFVELENGQPREMQPRKHIVNVGPGRRYSVEITADEPGEWAFHCHLSYHMATGMFRKVIVEGGPTVAKLENGN